MNGKKIMHNYGNLGKYLDKFKENNFTYDDAQQFLKQSEHEPWEDFFEAVGDYRFNHKNRYTY